MQKLWQQICTPLHWAGLWMRSTIEHRPVHLARWIIWNQIRVLVSISSTSGWKRQDTAFMGNTSFHCTRTMLREICWDDSGSGRFLTRIFALIDWKQCGRSEIRSGSRDVVTNWFCMTPIGSAWQNNPKGEFFALPSGFCARELVWSKSYSEACFEP